MVVLYTFKSHTLRRGERVTYGFYLSKPIGNVFWERYIAYEIGLLMNKKLDKKISIAPFNFNLPDQVIIAKYSFKNKPPKVAKKMFNRILKDFDKKKLKLKKMDQ